MIVGYAQNGLLSDALDLFKKMVREGPKPNNYTLAAVLSVFSSLASLGHALAQHGFGKDAAELFDTMLKLDIEPDQITYVGVLFACSHVGLVQQGFIKMWI
ncbi:pentatricopeptide repeat-containing protein At3g21470-like [Arachis ipaensis]|uniref:pentatricopeptide repeat-containing protein At3g21470-like n=1 Tax=Arachis ipaensis TaxID=130454 RepID=UPI000A2B3C42|nr:pentatricopeptide repeat-containing protein At3g21470-like [Arachis ipaensis]